MYHHSEKLEPFGVTRLCLDKIIVGRSGVGGHRQIGVLPESLKRITIPKTVPSNKDVRFAQKQLIISTNTNRGTS